MAFSFFRPKQNQSKNLPINSVILSQRDNDPTTEPAEKLDNDRVYDYRFYEIKSIRSKEFVKGLRKVTLVCENRPDIHCFLWIDESEALKHMQFLFDEKLIEWFDDKKELITSHTNRRSQSSTKSGVQKGARTIHAIKDNSIMREGIGIISSASFPGDYKLMISHTLS